MKKTSIIISFMALSLTSYGQKKASPYVFNDLKVNETTATKNQASSGTCWSFGTMAMIESDVIKNGKGTHDLSEMWIVRHTYLNKIKKYVRLHGKGNLSAGGNAHDLPIVMAEYGIVPEEAYKGLSYGTDSHVHGELDAVLLGYANAVIKNSNKTLTSSWIKGAEALLDAYFGVRPEKFTYQGKEYTPKSFASAMGLSADDYVTLTSFTHQPFYKSFAIEIPDNWAWGHSYNIPLNEFKAALTECVESGYTLSWASDVSEKGFAYSKGFAVLPETDIKAMGDREQDRWVDLSDADRAAKIMKFEEAVPEINVTPEVRQKWYDNYSTTDDHGMQIYGIAQDQDGNKFYKVKNSWGDNQIYKGHFYASEPFVLGKTMNFMVNKNALSKELKSKLNIK